MKTNINLEITTKQSNEDINSEMDLRNTWCYATVPTHDKLRLLGYDHEPIGCCKDYYYIDDDNSIVDLNTKPQFKPNFREVVLNEQGKFEFNINNKNPSEKQHSTKLTIDECQFVKYGFEKPDFECVILTKIKDEFIGYIVKQDTRKQDIIIATTWSEDGIAYLGSKRDIKYDLPPIKKPWYETCKFPILVWDEDNDLLAIRTKREYTASYLDTCKPLTNAEIEELKQ